MVPAHRGSLRHVPKASTGGILPPPRWKDPVTSPNYTMSGVYEQLYFPNTTKASPAHGRIRVSGSHAAGQLDDALLMTHFKVNSSSLTDEAMSALRLVPALQIVQDNR